jgi:hypothetical protein
MMALTLMMTSTLAMTTLTLNTRLPPVIAPSVVRSFGGYWVGGQIFYTTLSIHKHHQSSSLSHISIVIALHRCNNAWGLPKVHYLKRETINLI